MSLSDFASQYAPVLADIASQLEEFDAVICGCSAGPQKPDAPDQRQHLAICIDNPWREPDQWVTIYSASECEWWSDGERYCLTLNGLLNYLRQLPRPLHSFSKFQP
jgi:hypothetical protein